MDEPVVGTSLWKDAWKRLKRNKLAVLGMVVVCFVILASAIGPPVIRGVTGYTYDYIPSDPRLLVSLPPFTAPDGSFSWTHPMGTDNAGRDILARVLLGGRISLMVGIISTLVSLIIGISFGATAGYLGGKIDEVMMRMVDVLYAIPYMMIVIVLLAFFGGQSPMGQLVLLAFFGGQSPLGQLFLLFAALGAVSWLTMARIVRGQVISLMVGIISTLVSLIIGITFGATAGYLGGKVDEMMMRMVDVLYAIPYMMIVIVLLAFFGGQSPFGQLVLLFVALGAVSWLTMARIVRGQVISLKNQEFILAARATGVPAWKIIARHLVPNTLGPVIVYATLTIPSVMLLEAFLSFLGLGVQAPLASWGSLSADGIQNIAIFPWQLLCPGITMAITLFSLNFLGDGLRDALDPQMRKS